MSETEQEREDHPRQAGPKLEAQSEDGRRDAWRKGWMNRADISADL